MSGSKEFDLHTRYGSGMYLIEFILNSYSSSFHVSHMCSGGTITNVPIPASSQRVWKISKTSSYLYIYCSGVRVGRFSRSGYWSCMSDDAWNNFGKSLYFNSDSNGVTHYRRISS